MSSNVGLRRSAILIALIFLIADCSSAASSLTPDSDENYYESPPITHAEPILVDGLPPLMCGEELCDRPLRLNLRGDMPASEKMVGGLLMVQIWIGMVWTTVYKE